MAFFREVLGVDPWEKQEQIATDLDRHHYVCVASCNGAGKTVIASWIALYFMNCFQNCVCVVTAPVFGQVQLFWRQMSSSFWQSRETLGGEMQAAKYQFDDLWYLQGLASDKEEKYQGHHAPEGGILVVIVDEASGVKPYVFDAIQGYLTKPSSYVLLIGNPNRSNGGFYDAFNKTGDRWIKHSISAFDVPERIIGSQYIQDCRELWEENSPQWQVRVLGKFPAEGADYQLIAEWMLKQCADCVPDTGFPNIAGRHMGVDLSRGSSDNNVACCTVDGILTQSAHWTSRDGMETSQRVATLAKEWEIPDGNCHMEADGVGGPIIDRCRQLGMTVDEVRIAGLPCFDWKEITGNAEFVSRKAELAFVGRLLLMRKLAAIPEMFDPYWKDLQRINYDDGTSAEKHSGKIKMEDKTKLIKRLGRSPDFADAWFLSLSRMGAASSVWFV